MSLNVVNSSFLDDVTFQKWNPALTESSSSSTDGHPKLEP